MGDYSELVSFISQGLFFYIITPLFALLLLISIHEWGHFIVARWCGVRVDKFSVGFGRELWGMTDKKGTRWSLSAIPAGGYVKIFGDYDPQSPVRWDNELKATRPLTPEELAVAFCMKPVWQRMVIVMAGPLINLIPALVIMSFIFSFYGQTSSPPIINGIDISAAGYEAGFQLGDKILELDGKPVRRFEDVHDRTMKEFNRTFHIKILRDGKEMAFDLKPREEKFVDLKGVERSNGRIGMAFFSGESFKDIVSVDGISTEKDPDKARSLLIERFGKVVKIGTRYRQNEISTYLMVFPQEFNGHLNDPKSRHYDNIFLMDINKPYYVQLNLGEALERTFSSVAKLPYELYKRISARLAGKNDDQIVAGVGTISDTVADSAKDGIYSYIIFLCIFSIQLAIVNLLPIPVLDGGYMLFLLYEAIRGKPIPQKMQNYAFIIGMVLLLGIMVFANVSDFIYFLR